MRKDIKKRLDALNKHDAERFSDVLLLIHQGKYYDDLTDEQKERYCLYKGSDRKIVEDVQFYLFDGNMHFLLEENELPPTTEEMKGIIDDVERKLFGIANT